MVKEMITIIQVDSYKEGQRILERQRFQFPNTWLYSDNIEGEVCVSVCLLGCVCVCVFG